MVNWLILLDLVLLSAYFVNFNQQKQSEDSSAAIILLLLPFIYLGLYLIVKILQILWYVSLQCTNLLKCLWLLSNAYIRIYAYIYTGIDAGIVM